MGEEGVSIAGLRYKNQGVVHILRCKDIGIAG